MKDGKEPPGSFSLSGGLRGMTRLLPLRNTWLSTGKEMTSHGG